MLQHRSITILASLALIAGLGVAVGAPAQADEATSTATADAPAVGLIVKLADDADIEVSDLTTQAQDELPGDVEVTETTEGSGDLGLVSISEVVESDDLDEAIEALEQNPDVEWVVPNAIAQPTANPPAGEGGLWNLGQVRAQAAWTAAGQGSGSVRVAVVDTGILAHSDLSGQTVAGYDFVDQDVLCYTNGRCYYAGTYRSAGDNNGWDSNPTDPGDGRAANWCGAGDTGGDSTWHGTHVAGIVAAAKNNRGVAGVAPGVKVQPVRVLGKCGGTSWDVGMGMLWAAGVNVRAYDRRGPSVNRAPSKIVNLSLGFSGASTAQACRYFGKIASLVRAKGAIVIAAAGNDRINVSGAVPAACAGYVSVAATTSSGALASAYSNYGSSVDIAAPGGNNSNANGGSGHVWSTYNTGTRGAGSQTYAGLSGTSMAAPAVSGVAALAYSLGLTNPTLVERVIKATARRTACPASQCGPGVVDAEAVVKAKAPKSGPRISGSPRPGATLRASTGSWRNATSGVSLAWYRGSRYVGSGSAYRVTKADVGQRILVRARANGGNAGIYADASVVAKWSSKVAFSMAKKVKKSQRAKLRVKVVAQSRPLGSIRVYDGSKRIATKKIKAKYAKKRKASVVITLPKLRKGKHRIRVVYSGTAKIHAASSKRKLVRSR